MARNLFSACLILGLSACAGDFDEQKDVDYPVRCESEGACFVMPYQLLGVEASSAQVNRLPFPNDLFTVAEASSPTGRRLNLAQPESLNQPAPNSRVIDRGLAVVDAAVYTQAMNRLDGFGAFAPIIFETGEALDPALFSGDGTADDAPIFLVDIDEESSDYGRRLPYSARLLSACDKANATPEDCVAIFEYMILRPSRALSPGGRVGVFVTTRASSSAGLKPLMSNHFQEVWGVVPVEPGRKGASLRQAERERLSELRRHVEALEGLEFSEIVLAFDFSVAASTRELEAIADRWLPAAGLPELDLDPDQDGQDNIYAPADYPDHLPPLPAIDTSSLGAVVAGSLSLPDFRHQRGDAFKGQPGYYAFVLDADGVPRPDEFVAQHFFLFYPLAASAPMPVVLLQHGINSKKEDMASLVPVLAESGVACFMMDFPFHGTREQGFAPMQFVDFLYPTKARTSFQQSAAEHLLVLRALAGGRFDLWPIADADGQADFDPGRVGYFGNSLGAIVGAMSVALSPDVEVAVLAVGGGGILDFVDPFLAEYGLDQIYPAWYVEELKVVMQCLLDGGDSIHFAARMLERRRSGRLQVLAMEAMEDDTVPAVFSRNLSAAARYTQIDPVQFAIPGLELASPPYSGDGALVQLPGAGHNMVFDAAPPGPENRLMIRHFFGSRFAEGQAEVRWSD